MSLPTDLPPRYTKPAIVLHWLIAGMMLAAVGLGWLANFLPDAAVRPTIDAHKSVGLLVFGLAVCRLLWRLGHEPPPLPARYPAREVRAAHGAHWVLYGLMLLLPVTGYLHDSAFKFAAQHPLRIFWLIPFPRLGVIAHMAPGPKQVFHDRLFALHVWLGYALYAVFALHVAGALKHQWIDREPELQRMGLGR